MSRYVDADKLRWKLYGFERWTGIDEAPYEYAEDVLDREPTVDAVPVRHGKWIEYPECLKHEKAFAEEDIVCSCCGEVFNTLDNDTYRFKYCPNCGAKMDGEE